MKNVLIQIAAEKGNDVVVHAGRREKRYRTKVNGGGHSALLRDVTGSSSRCGCAAAQIQITQLFLELTSCAEDNEVSTSTAATLPTHYYKLTSGASLLNVST
jgi:hypothetical protein